VDSLNLVLALKKLWVSQFWDYLDLQTKMCSYAMVVIMIFTVVTQKKNNITDYEVFQDNDKSNTIMLDIPH